MWGRVFFVIVAVLALGTSYAGPQKSTLFGDRATLRLVPLAPPANPTNGRLTWLAGAKLTSDDPMFGGFSALVVAGNRFTLLNDGGNFVRFTLGAGGRADEVRFGVLPGGPGTGWEKRDRDSESLVVGEGGRLWVGFERANAIWRYDPGFERVESWSKPPTMQRWKSNDGAEAMVRLNDGRFVAFSEKSRWPGQSGLAAVVFAGDPTTGPNRAFRFRYQPAPGFAVSDAAVMPDGDIVVLERRWMLPLRFQSRLALVKAAALRPGALVRGAELGRIAPPWPIVNYEGVAATRERGATTLWLLSDNDQYSWRDSYLLKLRLEPDAQTQPARPSRGRPGRSNYQR